MCFLLGFAPRCMLRGTIAEHGDEPRTCSGIVGSVLPEDASAFWRVITMATVTESHVEPQARRATDYWIFLTAAIAISIVGRLLINTKFQAPTILTDELTYSQLARDIAAGKFSLNNGYGIVYPLLLAPSWVFNTYGTEAYTWMKATNAVLVSLTAIPVFFWAKRMMQPRYALLAAALTLLMPSMAYSGTIMTENAFLLFFMLAAWAIAVAVERPTIGNQILVVVAVVVAFETRAQAVVLLAALPLIVVLHVLAEERATNTFSLVGCGRRLVRFWPLAAIAALGVLAIVVRTLATDWHASQLLQAYSSTTGGQYSAQTVSHYFLWHLGEATFALGVIPVAALLLLVGMGILNRTRSSAERAYLSTAIVAIPLVILQVAIFTSWFSQRVSERNMFCVFPIVVIGLALWFDVKLPRPTRTTAAAAAITGVLVLAFPFAFLYQRAPSTETWGIVLPDFLTRKLSGGVDDVQVIIVVGVAATLLLFGILRPRIAMIAIPLVLGGYFIVAETVVVHSVGKAATNYRQIPSLGADASWLDQSVPPGSDVAVLLGSSLGPDADRLIVWQTQFFNKTPFTTATWGTNVVANPLTGAISMVDGSQVDFPAYVVTPSSFRIAGAVVADRGAFILTQPSTPYTLVSQSAGLFVDGWTGPTAYLDYFAATSLRTIHVQVDRAGAPAGVPPTTVTVSSGRLQTLTDGSTGIATTTDSASKSITGEVGADFDLVVPAAPFRIALAFTPSFKRSDYGQDDTRDLGARVTITLGNEVISR